MKGVAFVAALCLLVWSVAAAALPRRHTTDHFVITYESQFGATDSNYVALVEEGLESAYATYLEAGFSIFPDLIEVDIIDTDAGELGAEYLIEVEAGGWLPVIEIASQDVMEDYLTYAYVASSLEDLVTSTCAHEVFHVIQDAHALEMTGDISEQSFVEPHATAMQELVVPTANDYLDPALDFLLAPDGIAFFHRSYDAGIFWVYFLEQFGSETLLDLMASSASYDGRHAIDHTLASRGLTFFDVWADFALALATSALPDSDVIGKLVPEAEGSGWWTRTRPPAQIPPVVAKAAWAGIELSIETVSATNESEYTPAYEDDPIGTGLRIAHAYGIDIVEIAVGSTVPMSIAFEGNSNSAFRTAVASETSTGWISAAFEDAIVLEPDAEPSRIRIVITRSEAGTGEYTIVLSPRT